MSFLDHEYHFAVCATYTTSIALKAPHRDCPWMSWALCSFFCGLSLFQFPLTIFLKMEGFLEANRVVEVSLSKLAKSNTELPLRKALLIAKVMNKAQEAAESAQVSLVRSATSRCSSKLLASMQARTVVEDVAVRESDMGHVRPWTSKPRTVSPMVTSHASARTNSEDDMDFESVIYNNSVLSDILSNDETDMDISGQSSSPLHEIERSSTSTWVSSGPLADVSNTRDWSCWSQEAHFIPDQRSSPPPCPGKRHHSLAFPSSTQGSVSALFSFQVDSKRFKPSPPEGTSVEALPGFCEYLSPKNLCSAPLITYMFGKGFHSPSDPSTSDWPSFSSLEESKSADNVWGHLLVSPSKLIMAC